jgi:hypothetical protein
MDAFAQRVARSQHSHKPLRQRMDDGNLQ